jgi:glycosyltransferase involved in cell wall biosynthesis
VKISVLIPAYNCAKTIQATLESVVSQTVQPYEVIIMDDGSTDDTYEILRSYDPRFTILQQANQGAAAARNALAQKATGELIAFLDADDLWHPRYLEIQSKLFEENQNAVAFFTGHVNFSGFGTYKWEASTVVTSSAAESIDPLSFLKRYNATGIFASMSFCCVPGRVLRQMGSDPFCVSGAEDSYFCNTMPLFGNQVIHLPVPLVAYRSAGVSLSSNQLKVYRCLIEVFRLLEERYVRQERSDLLKEFRLVFAGKRRTYAKLLMGAGSFVDARKQFWLSLRDSDSVESQAKSLTMLFLSRMPHRLQPTWPTSTRG